LKVLQSLAEVKEWRCSLAPDESLGLVPTMGTLHAGHRSLLAAARTGCDRVALSIFVNPKQFAASEDLGAYPQHAEEDLESAAEEGVDLVWFTREEEMYPERFVTRVELLPLADRLCGKARPHHFGGVALVVLKLFNIFAPRRAYFGNKDFQQATIIERMVADLNLDIEIVRCPLVREPDGIALSSRNLNLSREGRRSALALSRGLFAAGELHAGGERDVSSLLLAASGVIRSEARVELEYLELVDPTSLEPFDQVVPDGGALLLVAAMLDGVRLIDNLFLGGGDGSRDEGSG